MSTEAEAFAELRRIGRRRGQRGHFTAAQALEAGLSRSQLARLVERGLLLRVAAGVYRFAVAAQRSWKDDLAAEILSTGGRACGLSGTALYDLNRPPPDPSVLVLRGGHGPRRHSTRELARHECAVVDGLPALAPVRAMLDAVHQLPARDRTAFVEKAIVRGLVSQDALRRRALELLHPKRPGCQVMLGILDALHPELARARNDWEALVVRRAREFGLPAPRLEFVVVIDGRRYILDAAWPDAKATLEFDGRDPHMRRTVHDYDTERRNDLQSEGWRRFGITAVALQRGDDRVFRQVARALGI